MDVEMGGIRMLLMIAGLGFLAGLGVGFSGILHARAGVRRFEAEMDARFGPVNGPAQQETNASEKLPSCEDASLEAAAFSSSLISAANLHSSLPSAKPGLAAEADQTIADRVSPAK